MSGRALGAITAGTAGAALSFAMVGCSLLVSTDGLATTAADAGATVVTDAPSSESSAGDASAIEAAADASDAAAGPFCASLNPKPKFCADFDKGSIGDYGSVFGTPSLDLSNAKSPPASLLSVVEPSDSSRLSVVEQNFPDTPTSFVAGFDLYVDEYDSAHDVEVVTVNLFHAGQNSLCDVNVAIRTNVWAVGEYCPNGAAIDVSVGYRTTVQLQRMRWTHVEVAADTSAAVRSLSLAIDGQPAFSGRLADGFTTGKVALVMGIAYLQTAATTRAKVHTDNVTFDYR